MRLRLITSLALLAVPVLGLLAACQAPMPRPTTGLAARRAHPAAAAYCRQRAEEMYAAQNRGARLQSDLRDTPFSGAYIPNATNRGLSDLHAMDTMIANCIRSNADRDAGLELSNPDPAQPATRPAARPTSPADPRTAAAPLDRAPPPPRP